MAKSFTGKWGIEKCIHMNKLNRRKIGQKDDFGMQA
jgi:hypothetical protein